MTFQPTAGHETAGARRAARPSHGATFYLLLSLLPLSALIVYVVLQVMASNAAAATGGCGGG